MSASEIVPGDRSGGATTSHTITVPALVELLRSVDRSAGASAYEHAVLEQNILGKSTTGSRQRTLRYLRELYLLRPDSALFRALRDLWTDDPSGQPLLACLCALARDAVYRASATTVLDFEPGDEVTSVALATAVEKTFPTAYSPATLAKIGRNTFASWEQTGHLVARARNGKVRQRATCTPSTVAYALLLGHLGGAGGAALFDTVWAKVLDQPRPQLLELASVASRRSLIDLRNSGGIVEVGFSELLRPMEGQLV